MSKYGMKYDYKKAYDKNLKPSARLHYLENARHDKDKGIKMYGGDSPAKNYMNPQNYKVFNMGNEPIPFKNAHGMKMHGGNKSPITDAHGMKMVDKPPLLRHCTPMRMDYGMKMKGEAKRDLMDMPLTKDMTGGRGPKMGHK